MAIAATWIFWNYVKERLEVQRRFIHRAGTVNELEVRRTEVRQERGR